LRLAHHKPGRLAPAGKPHPRCRERLLHPGPLGALLPAPTPGRDPHSPSAIVLSCQSPIQSDTHNQSCPKIHPALEHTFDYCSGSLLCCCGGGIGWLVQPNVVCTIIANKLSGKVTPFCRSAGFNDTRNCATGDLVVCIWR